MDQVPFPTLFLPGDHPLTIPSALQQDPPPLIVTTGLSAHSAIMPTTDVYSYTYGFFLDGHYSTGHVHTPIPCVTYDYSDDVDEAREQ